MVLELLFPYISANISGTTGTLAQSFTYVRKVTMGALETSPHGIINISNPKDYWSSPTWNQFALIII